MTRGVAVTVVLLLWLPACSRPPLTHAAGRKLIVLGVDGMDPDFLEAHWNVLPNLNRLRQTGDFRRLGTTIPPQSPVAWSSVTTGMDPGGHGIYDFVHRDPETRGPVSSMAETTPPQHVLPLGPYLIPLSGGGVHLTRGGRAFWQILQEHGIPASIIRMPANFPPAECEQESLSGMGTPDMQGSFSSYTFFTDDPAEKRKIVSGGVITHVTVSNGRATLRIDGPANALRKDNTVTSAEVAALVDPTNPVVRFDAGDRQVLLKEGEWSGWLPVSFRLIPMFKTAAGMVRIYLQQVHPHLRIYVSSVNIDPESPELPISTPSSFSRTLSTAVGRFYTQGIPEETGAYRAGLFTRAEFLVQSRQILADSLRLFRHELGAFSEGLLFYYFSSVDQNSHMLWGKDMEDLLDIYRGVDQAVGEAMAKAGNDTTLMIISDHGFAAFDRAVNLNTWLMREGLLALDDPKNAGDDVLFAHVDWSKTQAYAIGLNAVYLNLQGRERGGIVTQDDKGPLLERIKQGLLAFRDPDTRRLVVGKVYDPETAFQGRNLRAAPDLIVGFHRGYRASWGTALGAVPKALVQDNTQAWVGDHCMAADEVPGVLLANRKVRADNPQLWDITATILNEFGVAKTSSMIGHTVF